MINSGINVFLDLPAPRMIDVVQEAERLGFAKCWVYDEGLITRDPYVTMAAIAQKTKTIHIGTGITNPYTRHPAITAAAIATLDEMSGGRAFIGIGSGGALTLDPLGIELRKPLAAVREMISVTRRLFQGESVTFTGETVKLSSAKIEYAHAGIEIWLAARGPKLLMSGGELANGVALDFVYKDSLPQLIQLVNDGARITANQPRFCYSTGIVTSEETLNEVRPHMTYRLVNTPPNIKQKIGLSEKESDAIRQAMGDGLEAAGKLLKDEWIRPFLIMGSVEECARELRKLWDMHQFDEFLVPILNTATAPRVMAEAIAVFNKM